nr:hypothetical protein [Candidatus Freyarchaeota archaeon]
MHLWLVRSQSRRTPSLPPERPRRASGQIATHNTSPWIAGKVSSSLPLGISHRSSVPSLLPARATEPSRPKATYCPPPPLLGPEPPAS